MASGLSPQNESYLHQVVTGGLYPSKDAALDAAIDALREKNEQLPLIPEEHAELVEQAIASSEAGLSRPMTGDDWARLRKIADDAAARNSQS
jgi:hypothetical protein